MHVFVDAESKRWFSRSFESFHIAMSDLPCPWTAVKLAAAGQSPTWPVHNLNPSTTCDQTWVDFCQLALEGKRRSDRVRANLSCSAVAYRAKIPLRHVVCPHQEFHPNELPQKCLAMSSAPTVSIFTEGAEVAEAPGEPPRDLRKVGSDGSAAAPWPFRQNLIWQRKCANVM